jgi:4-hydroxybenzoyl-CoA thioesterase
MTYVTFRQQMPVEWGHCDPAGIVFNPRFFEYFDRNTWHMFATVLDVPVGRFEWRFGITLPLVDSGARFLVPAKFGDLLEVVSTVKEFRRSSFDIAHQIWNDGKLAAEGHETRVWAGRDPEDPSRLRGQPIPAEVIARFRTETAPT